jgi:hypothetical protein
VSCGASRRPLGRGEPARSSVSSKLPGLLRRQPTRLRN